MQGGLKTLLLLDVARHSLSLPLGDGKLAPLIARGTLLPARDSRVFATRRDAQDRLQLDLCQGEAPTAVENRRLGEYVVGGLPSAAAGAVQVQATFTVDASGLVSVTARETRSGRPLGVTRNAPA